MTERAISGVCMTRCCAGRGGCWDDGPAQTKAVVLPAAVGLVLPLRAEAILEAGLQTWQVPADLHRQRLRAACGEDCLRV